MEAVLATPFLRGREVHRLRRAAVDVEDGVGALVRSIAMASNSTETSAFNVLDLGEVVELFAAWRRYLNDAIRPYYAVKCNHNPALLAALAALGSGFDCASPAEMDAVLAVGGGVTADRIIYANPCKPESHLRYAARLGVNITTFDSVFEVEKIGRCHPGCRLLLRLKPPDDGGAMLNLGTKYGAHHDEVVPLLRAAHRAGLLVAGVSFHVGSAVSRPCVYGSAIEAARAAFDAATELGMPPMHVLDIGGGFRARCSSTTSSSFPDACAVINAALARHFGDIVPGVEVIAEPGRYFAETPFALAARIFGKRTRGEEREYWIDDGMFGSLCCVHFENYVPRPVPVASRAAAAVHDGDGKMTYPSTVFGPTLDSFDVVVRGYQLPELCAGDWLVFHDIGAYTTVLSSDFNGFSTSKMKTYLASSV